MAKVYRLGKGNCAYYGALWRVAQARSKGDTRYPPEGIKVEALGCIVATDGRRLYGCRPKEHGIEPGLYEVARITRKKMMLVEQETRLTYPKWQSVMPNHKTSFECDAQHVHHFLSVRGCYISPVYVEDWVKYFMYKMVRVFYDPVNLENAAVLTAQDGAEFCVVMPENREQSGAHENALEWQFAVDGGVQKAAPDKGDKTDESNN